MSLASLCRRHVALLDRKSEVLRARSFLLRQHVRGQDVDTGGLVLATRESSPHLSRCGLGRLWLLYISRLPGRLRILDAMAFARCLVRHCRATHTERNASQLQNECILYLMKKEIGHLHRRWSISRCCILSMCSCFA